MGCSRRELLARFSSVELSEWMAYYLTEPWGEAQSEYRAALVASTVANTARDPEKRSRPFEIEEFMRDGYKGEIDESEADDKLLSKARMIFGTFGKKP